MKPLTSKAHPSKTAAEIAHNARFPNAAPVLAEGIDDKTQADKSIQFKENKAKKAKVRAPTITTSPHLLDLTDETIAGVVEGSVKAPSDGVRTVLLVFMVPWCTPCKQVAPAVAQLANEFEGKVAVAVLKVETSPLSVKAFKVVSVPTFVVLYDGQETFRHTGGNFSITKARKALKHAHETERLAGIDPVTLALPDKEWVAFAEPKVEEEAGFAAIAEAALS